MAIPKVFISSTCYDLGQIRDNLHEFIESYFFEPTLSERGDVFYHPDLHTHESCITEIENCQLFILVIGGRFGGKYKFDPNKSITNAEYEAAKVKNIPVFTFIKREVFDDHRVYQKNKSKTEIISKIEFPSIENQEYASKIFEFINSVRLARVNNGFFSFEFAKDIKYNLGKQWAGMMHNFLIERSKNDGKKVVERTLDNLTLINRKTEELLESIYKKLSPEDASENISSFDRVISGAKFYSKLVDMFYNEIFTKDAQTIAKIKPAKKWYDYACSIADLVVIDNRDFYVPSDEIINRFKSLKHITNLDQDVSWTVESEDGILPREVIKIENLFKELSTLNQDERLKAFNLINTN